jgi:hypothetical protein
MRRRNGNDLSQMPILGLGISGRPVALDLSGLQAQFVLFASPSLGNLNRNKYRR